MSILQKHMDLVKEQEDFHEKQYAMFRDKNPFRATLHKTTADKFSALAIDLENADKLLDTPQITSQENSASTFPKKNYQLSLTTEDIEGLPEELIKELNISAKDKTEFAITTAIEDAGGIISLSKLLIALYKSTGEIYRRIDIANRMARMANKNIVFYVPGKKGIYSNKQLSSADVSRIFGSYVSDEEDE